MNRDINRGGVQLNGDEWFLKKPHVFLEMKVNASSTELRQQVQKGNFFNVPDTITGIVKRFYSKTESQG